MDAGTVTLPTWIIALCSGVFTVGFGVIATWCVTELRATRNRRDEELAYRQTAALALAQVIREFDVFKSVTLTNERHDEICGRWQEVIRRELEQIKEQIAATMTHNRKHRHAVRESLHVIELALHRIAPEIMLHTSQELRSVPSQDEGQ